MPAADPGASLQLTGQADFWHPTGASLQIGGRPTSGTPQVHQLANQVMPSSWQQPSAGGPMLMADDNFLDRNQASVDHLLEDAFWQFRNHNVAGTTSNGSSA